MLFTIEQADELVEQFLPIAKELQERYAELLRILREAGLSPEEVDRVLSEPQTDPAILALLDAMSACVGEIESRGCHVRGFEEVVVEFPARINGQPAFLCWRPDEPRVTQWRAATDPSSERRPLDSERGAGRRVLN